MYCASKKHDTTRTRRHPRPFRPYSQEHARVLRVRAHPRAGAGATRTCLLPWPMVPRGTLSGSGSEMRAGGLRVCAWLGWGLGGLRAGVHIGASVARDRRAGLLTSAALALRPPPKGNAALLGSTRTPRPFINARAACIKCGEGWMPGYWHCGARVHMRGFVRKYDPFSDKITCGHCRSNYPLGPYYFPGVRALCDKGR